MKTYTLSEIKTIVSRLAKQYGAERIYLFGSYARGDMTNSSDIDCELTREISAVFSWQGFARLRGLPWCTGGPCPHHQP